MKRNEEPDEERRDVVRGKLYTQSVFAFVDAIAFVHAIAWADDREQPHSVLIVRRKNFTLELLLSVFFLALFCVTYVHVYWVVQSNEKTTTAGERNDR